MSIYESFIDGEGTKMSSHRWYNFRGDRIKAYECSGAPVREWSLVGVGKKRMWDLGGNVRDISSKATSIKLHGGNAITVHLTILGWPPI